MEIVFSWTNLAFLLAAGFLGSFVDAVVGGGGMITLPAWMATGVPMAYALGSNKLAAMVGTISSFFTFLRSGKVDLHLLKYMPLSILGSAVGAFLAAYLPDTLMRYIVVAALVGIAVYTYMKKNWSGSDEIVHFSRGSFAGMLLMLFGLGAYDGFFGPGTGTFLIFGFLYFGYNFISAAGNAKASNLASNIGGVVTFLLLGKLYFAYAIPMALMEIVGARLGAKIAIHKGIGFIRPLYLTVTVLLIGKQVYDIFLH
jgi:uncharacterized membrane protein YfcA